MTLSLTSAQVLALRDFYLDTLCEINTMEIRQAEPYGDIFVRRFGPELHEAAQQVNARGEIKVSAHCWAAGASREP